MPDQMQDRRQPATVWGVVGEEGRGEEEADTGRPRTLNSYDPLYYTASIEASLDYYMNKNIILCPACLELI